MQPSLGAFEVSTSSVNSGNKAILFFSKQMSGMWPNAKALTNRLKAYIDDKESLEDEALVVKYFTSGRSSRASRMNKNFSSMNLASAASYESLPQTRSLSPG